MSGSNLQISLTTTKLYIVSKNFFATRWGIKWFKKEKGNALEENSKHQQGWNTNCMLGKIRIAFATHT